MYPLRWVFNSSSPEIFLDQIKIQAGLNSSNLQTDSYQFFTRQDLEKKNEFFAILEVMIKVINPCVNTLKMWVDPLCECFLLHFFSFIYKWRYHHKVCIYTERNQKISGFSLSAINRLKKPGTLKSEPFVSRGKWLQWGSEILKLPTTLDCQAAYSYILAVYFKT